MDWWQIVTGVFLILSVVLTVKWRNAKRLLKETAELLTDVSYALEDDQITAEELRRIMAGATEVLIAARALLGRL